MWPQVASKPAAAAAKSLVHVASGIAEALRYLHMVCLLPHGALDIEDVHVALPQAARDKNSSNNSTPPPLFRAGQATTASDVGSRVLERATIKVGGIGLSAAALTSFSGSSSSSSPSASGPDGGGAARPAPPDVASVSALSSSMPNESSFRHMPHQQHGSQSLSLATLGIAAQSRTRSESANRPVSPAHKHAGGSDVGGVMQQLKAFEHGGESSALADPIYVAPEELAPPALESDRTLSPLQQRYARDVYAFGIMLWQVFTWCRSEPYEEKILSGASSLEIVQAVSFDGLRPSMDALRKATPPGYIIELIRDCLEEDPAKRPDAAEICRRINT